MAKMTYKDSFDIKKEMLGNVEELRANLPRFMKETVAEQFKRDGIVIGVSGGIDSAVIATLAVEAMGSDHVYGLILPERESSPSSRELATKLCRKLKIPFSEVPITPMLESFGIYDRKLSLMKELFPTYDPAVHSTNLFLPPGIASERLLAVPSIRLSDKNGSISTKRLSAPQYLTLMSLQNVKQRTRMIVLYMQAEKMNYVVSGTTNKSELLTGYFVKFGDGGSSSPGISSSSVTGASISNPLQTCINCRSTGLQNCSRSIKRSYPVHRARTRGVTSRPMKIFTCGCPMKSLTSCSSLKNTISPRNW